MYLKTISINTLFLYLRKELLSSTQYVVPNNDVKKLIKGINANNQNFNINFSPNGFNYIKNRIN